MNTVETLDENVFRHLIMSVGELPTSFIDSMSYYEMIAWLVNYIKTQVVPAINNNAEAVKAIQEWIETLELGEYVDAKLEEMLENGELATAIAQIVGLGVFFAYDTVADMAAAENLEAGCFAHTGGFYALNDGGGATYKIRAIGDDIADNQTIIALDDETLVAELIKDEPLNVKKAGVHGDGETDDTTLIQNLIDNNPHKTLYFPAGTYKVTNTLKIKAGNDNQVNLELDKNATITSTSSISYLFTIGVDGNDAYTRYSEGGQVHINGGNFSGNNITDAVIKLSAKQKETHLTNLMVRDVETNATGIHVVPNGGDNSSDVIIQNVSVQGKGSDFASTGINLEGYDNKLTKIFIQKVKVGMVITGGGNFIDGCHILGSWSTGTAGINAATFNDTIGVDCQNQSQHFTDLYVDNMATGIKITGGSYIRVKGYSHGYYRTPATDGIIQVFHFADNHEYTSLYIDSGQINFPNSTATIYGIRCHDLTQEDYLLYHRQFKMVNVKLLNPKFITNQTDRLLDVSFNLEPTNYYQWTVTMTANAYYPIAYMSGFSKICLRMANDQVIEAKVNAGSSPALSITNIANLAHGGEYTLALLEGTNSPNGAACRILAVKSSTANSFNPNLVRLTPLWNDRISTCIDFLNGDPIDNPTVLAEGTFNPA